VTFVPELHARAAAELRAQASIIGARSVDAQLAASPGLAERFGPRGVEASLRDASSNVEHLAEAIALGDPEAFAAYVTWLRGVLVAAHVPAPVLATHLGHLQNAVRVHAASDSAGLAAEYIGLALGRIVKDTP
jgi:hypothetical protein